MGSAGFHEGRGKNGRGVVVGEGSEARKGTRRGELPGLFAQFLGLLCSFSAQ